MSRLKQWKLNPRTLLRLLLVLLAWGGLTVVVVELVPYQPRLRYVAPEGSRSSIKFEPLDSRIAYVETGSERTQQVIHLESGQSRVIMSNGGRNYQIRTPNGLYSVEHFNNLNYWNYIHSPDSKYATVYMDEKILLVDLTTGWYLCRPCGGDGKFSPDSTLMAFTSEKDWKSITVWNLIEKHAQKVLSFRERLANSHTFRFSRDSRLLLTLHNHNESGDWRNEIGVWDLNTGQRQLMVGAKRNEWALDFTEGRSFDLAPDGGTLAYEDARENEKAIELLDVASGKVRARLPGACYPLAFSLDGRSVTTDTVQESIKTWEVATGREQNRIPRSPVEVKIKIIYLDAAGTLLALGCYGESTVWDMTVSPARKICSVPQGYLQDPSPIRLTVVSPDGQSVVSKEDKIPQSSLVVMDLKTQQERLQLPGLYFYPVTPTFSPDSRFLAVHKELPEKDRPMLALRSFLKRGSVGDAHTIQIWDLATSRLHAVLPGCCNAGFWPDGKSLATLSEDGQAVEVWDLPLRKPLWIIAAWSLGLGLCVFGVRWLCGRILRAPERGT